MSQVWFITGSSRGLGVALVEMALRSGAAVIATARDPSSSSLQPLLTKYGPSKLLLLPLDVTDNAQVLAAVSLAVKTFGRIDVVVNNAGSASFSAIEDTSMDSFRAQLDVNFFGVVHVTKALVPVMRNQGFGRIIQISSIGGRITAPGYAAYQSAKWALGGFSTCLAQEVSPFGIKVTVLEPGGMDTEWSAPSVGGAAEVSEPYQQTVGAFWDLFSQSRGSWSSPGDVAGLVWRVAGEEKPPLRLLAGRATVEHARMALEGLAREDEKWRYLTTSV